MVFETHGEGFVLKPKVPPHSHEAEQSVLGGLMLETLRAWDEIGDILNEDHLYSNAHKKVFITIKELMKRNQPADVVTVTELLKSKNELDEIGGAQYIAEIVNATPSAVNIKAYAEIIVEKSILRDTISKCSEVIELAYGGGYESVDGFIDSVESKFFGLSEQRNTSGLVSAADIVEASLDRIQFLYESKASVTGVPSGFTELDKATTGFQAGELIIIAARPSMGKTALGLNIAANAALRHNKKIAFFSLEMGSQQIMIRLLASEARIGMSDMRVGRLKDSDFQKLIDASGRISSSTFFIDDTSGISPNEIRAKCRRLKAQFGLDMIVIDYLQMMDLKQKVESRERAVSEISKSLKALSKELQVPVVALAQLNRQSEGRKDRRPMLSDLRESGSIEQDADVIMMIYRDEYYEKENSEHPGGAEIIIGKQRNGPVGTIKLAWLAQLGTFANLAHETPPASIQMRAEGRSTPHPPGNIITPPGGVRNFAPKPGNT